MNLNDFSTVVGLRRISAAVLLLALVAFAIPPNAAAQVYKAAKIFDGKSEAITNGAFVVEDGKCGQQGRKVA